MALFKCHLAKGRLVDGAEIVVKIFIIASNANHGCVVGSVAELRDVNCPTILLSMFMESVAQTVVCRHAASHSHMLDACLLDSLTKLVHKNVDDGKLKTGSKVVLVMLHKVGIINNPLSLAVKKRCLKTAKAVIKPRDVGLSKGIILRVALTGKAVNNWTTRITKPHDL